MTLSLKPLLRALSPIIEAIARAECFPRHGQKWRHFKGGEYRVIRLEVATSSYLEGDKYGTCAVCTSSIAIGKHVIFYSPVGQEGLYVRALDDWLDFVAVPRFQLIKEAP